VVLFERIATAVVAVADRVLLFVPVGNQVGVETAVTLDAVSYDGASPPVPCRVPRWPAR